MTKHDEKQKKQDLGIFYTPPEVVGFIFDILTIWKDKEDKEKKRWQSREPRPHYPSIIDPAVGEGVFLKGAVVSGFTKPDWIFGADIDEQAVQGWKQINLLAEFGGKEQDLEAHFFHQNGLLGIDWARYKEKYKSKLRPDNINDQKFDAAVGNPPYGGIGVDFGGKLTPENIKLLETLEKFDIFSHKKTGSAKKTETTGQNSLFLGDEAPTKRGSIGKNEVIRLAHGMPIEILFVERFIQLVKPNGWIAAIIPDGILSNSNAHYVRDFIATKTKVEAIVSLPRETFKQAGTSAKTSILFLRKLPEKEKISLDYPVFMASVANISKDNFQTVAKYYQKFYNQLTINTMTNSKFVQITKDQTGREAIMVRVDKTVKELMEEKPSGRWDADYWHPKNDEQMPSQFEIRDLGNFVEYITYGVILTGKKREFAPSGIYYISSTTIVSTGINHFLNPLYVGKNDKRNVENKKPHYGDIVFNRSGVGTLGRQCVFLYDSDRYTISDDTNIIRFKEISPFFVSVFLKTTFGLSQIKRRQRGVSGLIKISFDDIKAIKIPILPDPIQTHIESEYKKMSAYHDKAMEGKKKGDEAAYRKNIETAEKMLKDLIARTETVIRGERKDVI